MRAQLRNIREQAAQVLPIDSPQSSLKRFAANARKPVIKKKKRIDPNKVNIEPKTKGGGSIGPGHGGGATPGSGVAAG